MYEIAEKVMVTLCTESGNIFSVELHCFSLFFSFKGSVCDAYAVRRQYTGLFQKSSIHSFSLDEITESNILNYTTHQRHRFSSLLN